MHPVKVCQPARQVVVAGDIGGVALNRIIDQDFTIHIRCLSLQVNACF